MKDKKTLPEAPLGSRYQKVIDQLGLDRVLKATAVRDDGEYPSQDNLVYPDPAPDTLPTGVDEPELHKRVKAYENQIKSGWDKDSKVWKPHKSREGGADTLAYGFKLDPKKYTKEELERFYKAGITEQEAQKMFNKEISGAKKSASRLIEKYNLPGLNPTQQEALAEMSYQMGEKGTEGFKRMFKALQRQDYDTAYEEALNSKWAKKDSPDRAKEVAQRLKFNNLKKYIYKNKNKDYKGDPDLY